MCGKNNFQNPDMIEETLDKHGRPTTYLCFNILKTMLREHNKYLSTKELCALLAAKRPDVELICKGLCDADYISRNPVNPDEFKYNIHCSQDTLQCNFERYLVDVETRPIPIHRHLPYSPSAT